MQGIEQVTERNPLRFRLGAIDIDIELRLAGAIAQVIWRILEGARVADAIDAPRVHVDGSTVHLEGGWSDAEAGVLPEDWEVVRWEGLNLFFGGVQAVEQTADGALDAAGDPRRGGVGLVVE